MARRPGGVILAEKLAECAEKVSDAQLELVQRVKPLKRDREAYVAAIEEFNVFAGIFMEISMTSAEAECAIQVLERHLCRPGKYSGRTQSIEEMIDIIKSEFDIS